MGFSSELYIQIQEQMINDINKYESGDLSCLDAYMSLKDHEKKLKECISIYEEFKDENIYYVMIEAKEYPEGYEGKEFQIRNGSTRYSYKGIEEVESAEKNAKAIKEKYKQMYLSYQNGNKFSNVDENGEELKMPIPIYGKPTVIIKDKK